MSKFFAFFFLLVNSAGAAVVPEILSREVQARFDKVPEFQFIKEEALKMGLRVYLFGGTASGFAHYVRWDLEREQEDTKFQAEKFDYDFTNIYRSNQDLDIVIDGTPEEAKAFQQILQDKYPHFVGSKTSWEVRLLRQKMGDKTALLNNKDFVRQHSDSNSTGLLDITAEEGEIVFRDLRDWENRESQFLTDVAQAKIKFYFSPSHEKTKRYKEGKNPPLLAAIRYLAKLTQYEVQGKPEDLRKVSQIIAQTDFSSLSSYGKKKAEEFGLKALLNSPDIEFACGLLDQFNLRKKLIKMDGNRIKTVGTLSWWMNKEPLRSQKLGKGSKPTARELFPGEEKIIIAHETSDFWAYENITRSARGKANVFISRKDAQGEGAFFGNGFYTKIGRKGARNTNLTIRFELHPSARLGTDFTYEEQHGFVIIHNNSAIKLVQEKIDISFLDFLKLLKLGGVSNDDKGLIEKFKRKAQRQIHEINKEEIHEFLLSLVYITDDFPYEKYLPDFNAFTIEDYIEFVTFHPYRFFERLIYYEEDGGIDLKPEWLKAIISKEDEMINRMIIFKVLSKEKWSHHPKIIEAWIDNQVYVGDVIRGVLVSPHWWKHEYLFEKIMEKHPSAINILLIHVFSKPGWEKQPRLIEKIIEYDSQRFGINIFSLVLSKKEWAHRTDLMEKIIEKEKSPPLYLAETMLTKEYHKDKTHWFDLILKHKDGPLVLIKHVFPLEHWTYKKDLIEEFIEKGKYLSHLIQYVFVHKPWLTQFDTLEKIFKTGLYDTFFIIYILSTKEWSHRDDLLDLLIEKNLRTKSSNDKLFETLTRTKTQLRVSYPLKDIVKYVLSEPHWSHRVDIVYKLLDEKNYGQSSHIQQMITNHILSQEAWSKHPGVMERLIDLANSDYNKLIDIRDNLFEPFYAQHPHLIEKIFFAFQGMASGRDSFNSLLEQEHWRNHPDLKEYMGDLPLNPTNFQNRLKKIKFTKWLDQKYPQCSKILKPTWKERIKSFRPSFMKKKAGATYSR